MAIRGVSLAEREEVILPHDPGHPDHKEYKAAVKKGLPLPEPTKFYIGNLTKACRIEIGDMSTSPTMRDGGVTMEMRRTKKAYMIVQRGLQGWDNMLDHAGNPAKFEQATIPTASGGFVKGASDTCMMLLGADEIDALAKLILEKNGMTRQAEGNFVNPLQQSVAELSESGPATDAPQTNNASEDAPNPQ